MAEETELNIDQDSFNRFMLDRTIEGKIDEKVSIHIEESGVLPDSIEVTKSELASLWRVGALEKRFETIGGSYEFSYREIGLKVIDGKD